MKRFLMVVAAMLALTGRGQVAMRALEDLDNVDLVCVTNYGPQVVSLTARVTGLEGSSNDWSKTVSNLAALSNNVSALSSRVTATNDLFSAWFSGLQSRTSYWDTAYSWGDWHSAVAQKLDSSATNGWETGSHAAFLTSEADPVALAALAEHAAYWPPNATASSWFTFTTNANKITITGYNIDGGTDVVIPDYINGLPVTTIGDSAFMGSGVTSIGGAGNVVTVGDYAFDTCFSLASVSLPQVQTVGDYAFGSCYSLASVSLPQVQTVGDYAFEYCGVLTSVSLPQAQTVGEGAFNYCYSLASVSLPQVQTVGVGAFAYCTDLTSVYFDGNAPTVGTNTFRNIPANQVKNYVTNPQATGWGATLGGMPVVRLPLYADTIYQAGELVATTQYVEQAIAAIPVPDMSDHPTFSQIAASNALPYTAWTGTITPADGTATVTIAHGNMPVLVADAPCVLTLDPTGYGTAGVSRVSLSYYPGTNSFTFSTNVIQYAETPTVDTNGWNTLLIRRVSNSDWKGVGL